MNVLERLRVIYELDYSRFQAGINKMRGATRASNEDIIRGASRAEATVAKSFKGISMSAMAAVSSLLSLGAAFTKLNQLSNSYITIENRLRSIGEFSDEAAEKLLAASVRSRTAIESMSTAVARIQKATGDEFETTIRRVETLNKLLSIGGASEAERASVMLQLSQALSSGALQGDELRSLREAAPIEVLDAIAKAAGVTRGELKKMGEEGKLTSDIVIKALDSLAETADGKLGQAIMNGTDAMTNLGSAATVFFGRLDEGLGSQEAFVSALTSMSDWMSNNADEAEELGRSIAAIFDTIQDYIGDARAALEDLGILTENAFKTDASQSFGDEIMQVIEYIAMLNGAIEGAAAVAEELFLRIADNIAEGIAAAVNSVIGAVQSMVNAVLAGVQRVAAGIDAMTAGAAALNNKLPEGLRDALGLRTEGTNIAGSIPTDLQLPKVELGSRHSSGGAIADIYDATYAAAKDGVIQAAEDTMADAKSRYNKNKGVRDIYNNAPLAYGQLPPSSRPQDQTLEQPAPIGGGAGGSKGRKGGGGKGGSGRKEDPFFEASEKDIQNIERQIELLGKSTKQQAAMRAEWEMLDEAKKRGLVVDDQLAGKIREQAELFGDMTQKLEEGQARYKQLEEIIGGVADAFAGALLAGESLREGLAQVLKGIASDILQSGIRNALKGQFEGIGGGGGRGFWSGIMSGLGNIFGGSGKVAGKRARGGPVQAGATYLVGEEGPERFRPNVSGFIDSNKSLGNNQGPADVNINIIGATGNAEIKANVDAGIKQALATYDKALPVRVKEINHHPRGR